MTVSTREHPALHEHSFGHRARRLAGPVSAALRAGVVVLLPPLAFMVAVLLCVAALVLADAPLALRAALVLGASVPASASIVVARSLLRAPVVSPWLGLGALPSVAGGWLLASLV